MNSTGKLSRFERTAQAQDGEDYYSSLARRVYFIAEVENWPYQQTVQMLNDKEGFERFYEQVSVIFESFLLQWRLSDIKLYL